jgi:hypothetical protein
MSTVSLFQLFENELNELRLDVDSPESTASLMRIADYVIADYFLMKVKPGNVALDAEVLQQWITKAKDADAIFSYANHFQQKEGETLPCQTINYTEGSLRDDFNFGALVLIKTKAFNEFLTINTEEFNYAGLYSFRLWASRKGELLKFDQFAYSWEEIDLRKSGQKQFDYVNPANRDRQIEMEHVATAHLAEIKALVTPPFKSVNFEEQPFDVEASVIIPVLNRKKTIADAIGSVLGQKANFLFNVIVIDNHSTDGTSDILAAINDDRLVHLIPSRTDLGIGGCWNEGINHPKCGRFAVQLDSDDLYSYENTLQKVVDKFREEQCAMVIGSYRMVNFKLEEIPPGVIDHREWTDDNGPNNALRINGLGAPRAFYTPIIRGIGFPNVSYGEDYAVSIAISRTFKVGRIYEPVYLCRRWDENTDSNLSIDKINAHNLFKDSLRTMEIEKRKESLVNRN